jgi:hypothetical protein
LWTLPIDPAILSLENILGALMRFASVFFLILACGHQAWAGQQNKTPAQTAEPAAATEPGSAPLPTERVEATKPSPADQTAAPAAPGEMTPAQVKEFLHNVWLIEYRIDDLLTQVAPERWKMQESTLDSFQGTLQALRRQLKSLEEWRGQFDARPDSAYLAYQTYAGISGVLPRLDGVARSISQHENASFGAQYSQAGNKLFDLQQTLGTYLGFLLRNQDQVLYALQSNLAACHTELSYAMQGKTQRATPMTNILPQFKGRRVRERAAKEAEKAKASNSPDSKTPPKQK